MKYKIFSILLAVLVFTSGCKKDFLDRYPLDRLEDATYWTSENNIRIFAYGFYPAYFSGYGSGFAWGKFFSGQSLNDDFAPTTPTPYTKNVPSSGGGWTFTWVRKANIMINRVQNSPIADDAKKHWVGIGRFFRGLEYYDLVRNFGDIPWYDQEMNESDAALYKARDPRNTVMDNVLSDMQFAAENVRVSDGTEGLSVNRYVVLAMMSRIFLFEGTFQKYHFNNTAKATQYLEASRWAANEIIKANKYTITDNFRSLFNSLDLNGKKEVILYRQYEAGILTHSLHSYVNLEPQSGASKDAVESFLAKDGLPIGLSPLYKGDKGIANVVADRDPRLTETIVPDLRLKGMVPNYSTSGYAVRKFFNETLKDLPEGSSSLNRTDAPVIRYGEVLLNYAEAVAELGTLTQEDLDKSINKLRSRPGIMMPHMQVLGGQPAVGGVVYDDPDRDPTVPSLIWEIRRERRTELMFEGFRLDDLKRWKKLAYTDTESNIDINRGAWIKTTDYATLHADVKIDRAGTEGYIVPSTSAASARLFNSEKYYLEPIPLDQIQLYQTQGVTLNQNPGWQ